MVFATPDDARLALERAPTSGFRWRPFAQACAWRYMILHGPLALQPVIYFQGTLSCAEAPEPFLPCAVPAPCSGKLTLAPARQRPADGKAWV